MARILRGGDDTHDGLAKKDFFRVLKEANAADSAMSDARGTLGGLLKAAYEKGLNGWGFRQVRALDKLEPAKLADRLRAFDEYREWMGLDKKAGIDIFDGETGKTAAEKPADGARADEANLQQVGRGKGLAGVAAAGEKHIKDQVSKLSVVGSSAAKPN